MRSFISTTISRLKDFLRHRRRHDETLANKCALFFTTSLGARAKGKDARISSYFRIKVSRRSEIAERWKNAICFRMKLTIYHSAGAFNFETTFVWRHSLYCGLALLPTARMNILINNGGIAHRSMNYETARIQHVCPYDDSTPFEKKKV